MKLILNADELVSKLTIIGEVLPSSPHIAVLENLKLSINSSCVEITARDLDRMAKVSITDCSGYEKDAEYLLPGKMFINIVSQLTVDSDKITLEETGNFIKVTGNGTSIKILKRDVSEFLPTPEIIPTKVARINREKLINLLKVSVFARSDKAILTNVHLKSTGGMLLAEATNSLSGGKVTDQIKGDEFDICIPGSLERIIRRTLFLIEDEVDIKITEKHFWYITDEVQIMGHLFPQAYYDISKLYGDNAGQPIVLDKHTLSKNIKLVSSIGTEQSIVEMIFSDSKVVLFNRTERGEAAIEIPVENCPLNMKMKLKINLVELHTVLSLITGEFEMYISSPKTPILIKHNDGIYFIIPQF